MTTTVCEHEVWQHDGSIWPRCVGCGLSIQDAAAGLDELIAELIVNLRNVIDGMIGESWGSLAEAKEGTRR